MRGPSLACALLATAVIVGGCPASDDCPIGAEGCPCTRGGGCDPGLDCRSSRCVALGTPDAGAGDAPASSAYGFVMIVDQEPAPAASSSCGVDVDAVVLVHEGAAATASTILDLSFGSCTPGTANDATRALGSPEASCELGTFVSLGGADGTLVVAFDRAIVAGDTLRVHECIVSGIEEHYDVYVGPSSSPADSRWVRVMAGVTGVAETIVPALP